MADHEPYIPATHFPAELTPRALILGVVLGLIFSASSVYLALKIGLTVSSSIPIAVLSITIFRALGRTSILENNIVQTTGSASDSVAAGVVFTIPAVLLMGYDLEIGRVAMLATVGGLMGVLMMIPLRRALIVKEHDTLIYPEGTACAEVLIAGEERGLQAKRVFQAFGAGFVYKFLMGGFKLWPDVPGKALGFYPGAAISTEISPELLGVGYIIGQRIAGYLFAGGCFAYLVLAPAIKLVGSSLTGQIGCSANPISGMTIAALLGTCLIFVAVGWTGVDHRVQAISIAAVVAVATANAGNTSQDLKTGFLVGSTPRRQQIAILVGALAPALAGGWTLTLLNRPHTSHVPRHHTPLGAPALAPTAAGRAPVEVLPATMAGFRIAGSDSVDHAAYQVVRVYVVTDGVAAGKYLMDPKSRELPYVLDPGLGGRVAAEYRENHPPPH